MRTTRDPCVSNSVAATAGLVSFARPSTCGVLSSCLASQGHPASGHGCIRACASGAARFVSCRLMLPWDHQRRKVERCWGGKRKSNSIRYTRWVVMCTEASLLPGYAVIICVGVVLASPPRLVSGRILPSRFHPGEPSRCCVSASLSYQDQTKKNKKSPKSIVETSSRSSPPSIFPRPCTQLVAETCKTNRLLNARASCSVAYGKQCAVPARSSSEPEGGEHVPSWTSLPDG
jgi:hypothetical protein